MAIVRPVLFLLLLGSWSVAALGAPATLTLPADPPAVRTVALVEQWRIGGEEEEDLLLGVIFGGAIGPDGNVYLIDRQLSQVLVISPAGELVTTLGRQGQGPGELNNPHGLLLLEDGTVGVIQGFPGRVTVINPDDTPGGTIDIGGPPAEGGFNFVRELARCGNSLVGVRGRATFDMESGKSVATSTMAVMDLEGVDQVVIAEHTQENDLQKRVYDEAAEFTEMDTWAAGGDGVVVTAPARDRWEITVRGLDGEIIRVLQRDFTVRKRNDEDRAELTDGMVIIVNGQRQEIESKTLEHDPAIMGLDVAADGRLFVTSCFDQRKLLKDGVAARYDVISAAGEFVEQLVVTVPEFDGTQDALFFLDGEGFLLIRNFDQATESMTAGFGGGDDNDAEDADLDAEPLEVVYYRMP
jgi:hypothetical protein